MVEEKAKICREVWSIEALKIMLTDSFMSVMSEEEFHILFQAVSDEIHSKESNKSPAWERLWFKAQELYRNENNGTAESFVDLFSE